VHAIVFRPVVTIGSISGRDDEILARSLGGFRNGRGIIIARPGSAGDPRVQHGKGALLRRTGREGAGPGEFRHLTWIAPLGGDSVAALDGAGFTA
jgi:hypothetical protein